MAAWEAKRAEFEAVDCTIYAASVDSLEHAREAAERLGLSYPVAYSVTRDESELIGAWWSEQQGGFIEPSEFLLGDGGVVLGSMYASGPIGRMSAGEALSRIGTRERRRREQEQAAN